MHLKEIKNKDRWQERIRANKQSQFLQSWQWGEFQRSLGRKIWHLD